MTEAERRAALERIADEVRACTRCRLHEGRTQAVPGEGHPSTEVLFIGEAPGLNEDRQGRPFVGAAGQLLDELLGSVGWHRDEVYITNVVKCRPPQNRDPEADEIAACAPFLQRQLEALEPTLIVTLGRHSMARFLPGARIGQVHGTVRPAGDGSPAQGTEVFAMYHPAAALHQGSLKATLLDDMARIPVALVDARAARTSSGANEPESRADDTAVEAEAGTAPPGAEVAGAAHEGVAPGSDSIEPVPGEPGAGEGLPAGARAPDVAAASPEPSAPAADEDQMMMFRSSGPLR